MMFQPESDQMSPREPKVREDESMRKAHVFHLLANDGRV